MLSLELLCPDGIMVTDQENTQGCHGASKNANKKGKVYGGKPVNKNKRSNHRAHNAVDFLVHFYHDVGNLCKWSDLSSR